MGNCVHKSYAPTCALPRCSNLVTYHSKKPKDDGGYSYKWKTFCEYHRTNVVGKSMVEAFKKSRGGCESEKLGWPCPGNHGDFTIDHYDGNKHNNSEDNLLVLCHNCHNKKTKEYKDYNNRYNTVTTLDENLFKWD